MDAVAFVTDTEIMGAVNIFKKDIFDGTGVVSVHDMACYLAELADTGDMLNLASDRIAWAKDHGLLSKNEKLTAAVTVKKACKMVTDFVRLLEEQNGLTFAALEEAGSPYEVMTAMDLVTRDSYTKNAKINRYDMAVICYVIAQLEVK